MTGKQRHDLTLCLAACILILVLPLVSAGAAITTEGSGSDAAAIQGQVDIFRGILGAPVNGNSPGPLSSGRREINWDGGGATTAASVGTPFAGFQNTRGALFTTPGTGFLQTPLDAPEFLAINATYGVDFEFFSPVRIFTPVGSNITDVTFTLPGAPGTAAYVTGFGAVFSDVDQVGSATLQFFGLGNNSLGTFSVPAANNGLSFLGVNFDAGEKVGRIRITSGSVALGPNDGPDSDVVVMDDFLYSEPQPIPEPASMLLFGTALASVAVSVSRRKKQS
jgi:hypothetical protein